MERSIFCEASGGRRTDGFPFRGAPGGRAGRLTVNGEKVTDIHTAYEAADFDEEFVLKKGKKKFCKIVYK